MDERPLFLSEADLMPLLDIGEAITCLEAAFTHWGATDVVNLPRQRARPPQGVLNLMGAVDGNAGIYVVKNYFATPSGVRFYIGLYSTEDGRLLAMMESAALSQIRTGAASGLATRLLALPDARTLAMIGTGRQAFAQAAAVCAVRPITRILVSGRNAARTAAFAARLERDLGRETRVAERFATAVSEAEVVVTITNSEAPVLEGAWLQPGTHVNAAGANTTVKRELDAQAVSRSAVLVTDDRAQARGEAAEFIDLAASGALDWARVSELGALVRGDAPGRSAPTDITLFKSLGIAFEDGAYALFLYRKALEAGVGTRMGR